MTSTPLLERIDAYCDAIPRLSARAEEIGSLVLSVPEHGSWPTNRPFSYAHIHILRFGFN